MLSFDILRIRDFRLLLLTRLFGTMALQAQAVIVGWQVYSITKDPFMLGLVGLIEAIPAVCCALFAGHIVDNSRPYRVYVACIAALCLNMIVLALIGGYYVDVGNVLPWIYGGVFISGIARAFVIPASFSLQPQIVPRDKLSAASAWMTSVFQIGIISGPAIAGIIYGGYGVSIAWIFPASIMIIELIILLSFSKVHHHFRSSLQREKAAQSIKAGWKFIIQNPVILGAMSLDMFAVLFGGAVAMLPAYADRVLHVGAEELGLLRSAPALGAVIITLALAMRPLKSIRVQYMLWVVAGFGLCIIGFGLSTSFWLSVFFLVLSGSFDSVSMIIRQTLVQWVTPENMRGRVSSVNSMFVISSNEIGAFESGLAARLLGLVPSVVFGGACTLVIVSVVAMISPKLRKLKISA